MADSFASRPAPTANGTLAKTPFVHLLLYCLDKKLSGTLELLTPDQRSATIILVAGQPAKIRTKDAVAYLGRVMAELGLITEDQLTRSLADLAKQKAMGKRLHGEVLRAQGVVDETQLRAGLHGQIARKLEHVGAMPGGTAYGYYDGYDALKDWGLPVEDAGIDPYPALWPILRQNPPTEQVSAALARIEASPLRLRPADVLRLKLPADASQVIDILRARPMRVADLAKLGHLDEGAARLLAYLLLVTKLVDVLPPEAARPSSPPPSHRQFQRAATPGVAFKPGMPPASSASMKTGSPQAFTRPPKAPSGRSSVAPPAKASAPPPPPGLAAELTVRWQDIAERAATIDRTDYFNMLDIARDATPEQIESAFLGLAKQWHPDRLPAELAPVRDACSRVFARMGEARSTLTDPKQRERYMNLLADGSGSPEMQETVAKVIEAATSFQKAEVCFKRNDLAQAEEFCIRAIEQDGTQADYHALLAWLTSLKPENQAPEGTTKCVRMLDAAVHMNNKCEKAYFWRGLLYKRLGRTDHAARDFKKAADLNPKNIDAVREVRLFTMRGGASSTPPTGEGRRGSSPPPPKVDQSKGGLFGRLFKKP